MPKIKFPPLEYASEEGIVAIGGSLTIENLLEAYQNGIFPWPVEEAPLLWFSPNPRAILDFKDLHIPKRLQQELRHKNFQFKIDQRFDEVLFYCAEGKNRKQNGTWITEEIQIAYQAFHRAGFAHSFECYQEDQLVGGLYGVSLGSMFAGESMFYLEPGASKAALLFAIQSLQKRGATWMDIQVMSPLLKSFGAHEISRKVFLTKLKKALHEKPIFP
ncbi:MAG: leucyl/phenylalanyl-tRNA--protein transferase [Deltaproteobacteria bacterium]|nr:leucyl/phenylalanyl-tRNA--protein transferase [Deltaproteobacteria bacterium]